jgi:hypothetical protein
MSVPKRVGGLRIVGPLTYGGKKGCTNGMCRREFYPDGTASPDCLGWHCSYCDAPCSYQGHNCDVAVTLLAESRRLMGLDR